MFRTNLHRWSTPLFLTLAVALLGPGVSADSPKDEKGFKPLFNGEDLEGWKTIPAKAEKTFFVKDGMLVVTGNPAGYFYTDRSYKNFILRFDWRFKRPENLKDEERFPGNSGLLVHIQGEHRVWPRCIEVQGANQSHGNIFAIGGAKGSYKFDPAALKKVRNPVGEWNTTEVISRDGRLTSKVNGTVVSSGTSDLMEGPFGFQSEGSELHFKNIRIKVLD